MIFRALPLVLLFFAILDIICAVEIPPSVDYYPARINNKYIEYYHDIQIGPCFCTYEHQEYHIAYTYKAKGRSISVDICVSEKEYNNIELEGDNLYSVKYSYGIFDGFAPIDMSEL